MILVAYRHGLGSRSLWTCAGIRWTFERPPACPQGQAGHAEHPSDPWGRTTGPAAAPARPGAQVALRVHVGAGRALHHRWVRPHGRARRASRPAWPSRHTRTCYGTPAAMLSRTRGTTRARFRPTSGTATSSTRCATRSFRRRGSRISGGAKRTGDTMAKTKIIRRRVVEDVGVQRPGSENRLDGICIALANWSRHR